MSFQRQFSESDKPTDVSQHWRTVVSQPCQGPIPPGSYIWKKAAWTAQLHGLSRSNEWWSELKRLTRTHTVVDLIYFMFYVYDPTVCNIHTVAKHLATIMYHNLLWQDMTRRLIAAVDVYYTKHNIHRDAFLQMDLLRNIGCSRCNISTCHLLYMSTARYSFSHEVSPTECILIITILRSNLLIQIAKGHDCDYPLHPQKLYFWNDN